MAEHRQIPVEVFESNFSKNLWNSLWVSWKSPCMVLRKLGVAVDQYGQKTELPNNL
jgi:hypothetical protein